MRWEAQPRQAEFLESTEDEVLYGGAAGGGKTDALLVDGICVCQDYPGAQALFLRKTFADLNKPSAAIPRSHELLTGHAAWHGVEHRWNFKNGSVLQFGHVQHETDVYSYQGSQPVRLLWDELTQFSFFTFNYLRSRVRSRIPGLKPGIRSATNPGGVGHAWVKERYVDAAPWGESFLVNVDGSTVSARFIPAKLSDNTALLATDPDYQNRLRALGGDLAKALLEGDWNVFEGQFFKEWRAEKHVIDPFPIPQHWPKWTGTDDGVARPFVTLWLAQDPLTYRVYIYRELSIRGIGAASQRAQLFHDHCGGGEVYARHMADPSMWNREKDTGMCVADIFRQEGIRLEAADNDRYSGWQIWHEFLRDGDDGIPNLQVFSTCRQLIRNLPSLVHDDIKVEDLDTDGPDDEADAGRYALTAAKRIVPVVIESSRMAVMAGAVPGPSRQKTWWQEPARRR